LVVFARNFSTLTLDNFPANLSPKSQRAFG
jgi:hypothetical protein